MTSHFDSRDNNLDFLRLFFAVLVIFSHSYPLGTGTEALEPMMRLTHGQTTLGTVAVDAFFIISGFLITNSFLRSRSMPSYFRKRVARIYPAFLVCVLFCVVVVGPLGGAALSYMGHISHILRFAGSAAVLQLGPSGHAFIHNRRGEINGSLWSVSYEFGCYIGVALLGVWGLVRKRVVVLTLLVASLLFLLSAFLLVNVWRPGGHFWTHVLGNTYLWERTLLRAPLIPMYLSGMVFYLYRERIRHNSGLALLAVAVLIVSCFVPYSWMICFPIFGTYLIFWFGFHPRVRIHHFARFGDFSYGTYLYAFPIQQLIVQLHGGALSPLPLFLYATPPTLLVAVLSWHGVEKWFLSPRRRRGEDAPILAMAKMET
jgi:peptidoglycan/LPS O-acetylase OafA/YrhL